jgi:hypothetical protein
MKEEVKNLWIADLRANPEKQGFGALHTDTGECCLGRLCLVLGYTFVKVDGREGYFPSKDGIIYHEPGDSQVLPEAIRDEAGMKSKNGTLSKVPFFGYPDTQLSALNDGGPARPRKNFNEIADVIEQHWQDL